MSINDQVISILQEHLPGGHDQHGFSGSNVLILAVSGGPDSLGLFHLLCVNDLYPRKLMIVAHLNHGLRPSAGEEEDFVLDFAAKNGVRAISKACDVAGLARSGGLSVEEAGRLARYQFFAEVATEYGSQFILTGHNADDQVETILMHFLRGSAMGGLRGMQPVAPLPGKPELTLLWPFLTVSRTEIEAYCDTNKLTPVLDESNLDTSYYRNRLRHELIPMLEQYNPGLRQRMENMVVIMADEDDLLKEMVSHEWNQSLVDKGGGWLALDRLRWHSMPVALQRRVIRYAVQQLKPDLRNVGFHTTEQARTVAAGSQVGSRSTLPSGLILQVGYKRIVLSINEGSLPPSNMPQLKDDEEATLPVPGILDMDNGWMIRAEIMDDSGLLSALDNQDPWQAYVNVEDPGSINLRGRKPGETFQPLGMASRSAKISRVMIDRKIPQKLRARWPIVADGRHLLWLVGHQIDERAKITKHSSQIIHLQTFKKFDEQ